MSRVSDVFQNGKAFIPFVTAGDPNLETTERLIPAMAEAGADLIEIGIPFSDPIAEGIVIQEADMRALASGTTTDKIFEMVKRIRERMDTPLAFMTYINPIFVYGAERFLAKCKECGVDALIVPDMPFEGTALDETNTYQYGPVCVDVSVRGTGVFEGIFKASLKQFEDQYPVMVTFINQINGRSYAAHTKKAHMTEIGTFDFNNNHYWMMAIKTR